MAKKVYLVIALAMLLALLGGFSNLIAGIRARGVMKVNYGQVVFPLIIGGWAFWRYGKAKE